MKVTSSNEVTAAAIDLTADVINVLPHANGGTGNNAALFGGYVMVSVGVGQQIVEGFNALGPVFENITTTSTTDVSTFNGFNVFRGPSSTYDFAYTRLAVGFPKCVYDYRVSGTTYGFWRWWAELYDIPNGVWCVYYGVHIHHISRRQQKVKRSRGCHVCAILWRNSEITPDNYASMGNLYLGTSLTLLFVTPSLPLTVNSIAVKSSLRRFRLATTGVAVNITTGKRWYWQRCGAG